MLTRRRSEGCTLLRRLLLSLARLLTVVQTEGSELLAIGLRLRLLLTMILILCVLRLRFGIRLPNRS